MQQQSDSVLQQHHQQQFLLRAAALAAAAGSNSSSGSGGGGTNAAALGKYSVFSEISQQVQQQQQQQVQQQQQQNRRHSMGGPLLRHQQHQLLLQGCGVGGGNGGGGGYGGQRGIADAENIPPSLATKGATGGADSAAGYRPVKRGRFDPAGLALQQQQQQQAQPAPASQPQQLPPPAWAAAAHALQLPQGLVSLQGAYGMMQPFYPMLQLLRPLTPAAPQQLAHPQQQQQQQTQPQAPQTQQFQLPQAPLRVASSTADGSGASETPLDLTMPKSATAVSKPTPPPAMTASFCTAPTPLDLSLTASSSRPSVRHERPRKQRRSMPPAMMSSAAAASQQQRPPVPMLSPLLFPSPTLPHTVATTAAAAAPLAEAADHLPRVDLSPETGASGTSADTQMSAGDDPSGCRGGRQPVTTCHQCGLGFLSQGDMNAHFELEHLSALLGEFDNGKSWKSSAVENKELNVEATMVRLENGDTIGFKCPECDYFAKWPTELQKHIMVHSSARPHVCVVCGCTYKWKWDLGRHFDRSHESTGMPNPYKKNSARPPGAFPSVAAPQVTSSGGSKATPGGSGSRAPRRSGGGGQQLRLSSPSTTSTTTELLAYYSTPARSAALAAAAAAAAASVTGDAALPQMSLPAASMESPATTAEAASNPQLLACPICGAQARWPAELKAHVVGHSDFQPFRCSGCPYVSRWRSEVQGHLESCEAGADATVLCELPHPDLFADEAEVATYSDQVPRRLDFDEDKSEDDKAASLLKSESGSPVAPHADLPRAYSPGLFTDMGEAGASATSSSRQPQQQQQQQQQQSMVPQSPCRLECGGNVSGIEQPRALELQ